jgi:hypothetical protein
MAEHPCPCGCGRGIRADKLSCAPSWAALDMDTRLAVYRGYNVHGARSMEHLRAIGEASRKLREWGRAQREATR